MRQAWIWRENMTFTALRSRQSPLENLVIPKRKLSEIAVKSVHTWITENDDYDIKVVFSCVDPKLYELLHTRLCCL